MARNKYPEETVKLILDVATHLFVEKGYDATSLQDIINETNLSKGAIYHHFSSKEEIFEAIFHRIGEENTSALAKVRDDTLLSNSFIINQIVEPQPPENMMDIPGMADEMRRPMMLIVSAKKKM